MKAYIEILSNNGVDFPRPLVEKWPDVSLRHLRVLCKLLVEKRPDVSPTTPAHIVAELFASWVLENIDAFWFDYFVDDAFWLHIGRRKGDKFSFRCIAHAGRDVYPFTVSGGDEII